MRQKAVVIAAAILAAIGLGAKGAQAQGFSVYEHDACSMGRSGAGVAAPCAGGSAIFFNPAGIVTGKGAWNLTFGATLIPPRGDFTSDAGGTPTEMTKNTIPVPHAYLTRQLGSRWAIGVGAFAPYGLTTEWPETSPGRFVAYKTTLAAIYVQPTIAYMVSPRLQVGAGLDYVHTTVELRQRVDLSSQLIPGGGGATFANIGIPVGTDFADAKVKGTANSWSGHFGIIWRPTDRLSLGARYMMGATAKGSGTARFTQVNTGILLPAGNPLGLPAGTPLDNVLAPNFTAGTLQPQSVDAKIALPAQLVGGFAFKLTPALQLLADAEWTQWSSYKELPLTFERLGSETVFENYKNTIGWRAALEWAVTPKATLRGGFLTHPAAAPDWNVNPMLPEAGRFEGIIGGGYQLARGITVNGAVQYIHQNNRQGIITAYDPAATSYPQAVRGTYKFKALLFGLGATFAF